METNNRKTIYLAGGCFWGVEEYMSRIEGVISSNSGYANGTLKNPTYKEVCSGQTGHVETVRVVYDVTKTNLNILLDQFFRVVNPTTLNYQGNDHGTQYRSGIYYVDNEDCKVIVDYLEKLQEKYQQKVVVETMPLDVFYLAEEYHQKYLQKNPTGYCHIDLSILKK